MIRTPILALLSVTLGAAFLAPGELVLKKNDHEKFGKKIHEYWEARTEKKGINEAFTEITDAVEKQDKRLKSQSMLSFVEDWEQIFYVASSNGFNDRVKKGRLDERSFDLPGKMGELEYSLHAPSAYSTRNGPYPLILVIPDKGGNAQSVLESDWMDVDGRDKALIAVAKMPANSALWREFKPGTEPVDGLTTLMFLYGHLKKELSVDIDRVFLAGTGEGAGAAFSLAQAFPHLFAGVIARGAVPETNPLNFRHVPTLFLSTGTHVSAFEEQAKELGYENVTLASGGTEADVWAWVDANQRDPYPATVTFRPPTIVGLSAYWITAQGADPSENPLLQATVDRASNLITIDAENVASVQVYLNDQLVDMDRMVKFVVNGRTHEQKLDRNVRFMVDAAYTMGDWGRVFTNWMEVEVPVKGK